MSLINRLLYKWAIPYTSVQSLRFKISDIIGRPLDWNYKTGKERNLLLYESADALGELWQPLIRVDDTFILQEYFIPHSQFNNWFEKFRNIITTEILNKSARSGKKKKEQVYLLNTTIRYVYNDDVTYLPYANCKLGASSSTAATGATDDTDDGMFAFVLYYRINRHGNADKRLAGIHNKLVDATLGVGGTFYLPYRHHYDKEQIVKSYPMFEDFVNEKIQFDPNNVFDNIWFQHYGKQFVDYDAKQIENIQKMHTQQQAKEEKEGETSTSTLEVVECIAADNGHTETAETAATAIGTIGGVDSIDSIDSIPKARKQPGNAYASLFDSPILKMKFKQYLNYVFNVENPTFMYNTTYNAVLKAQSSLEVLNGTKTIDEFVYNDIKTTLSNRNFIMSKLIGIRSGIKLLKQLYTQKQEINEQTLNIIKNIGGDFEKRAANIKSHISVGDSGKMIKLLRKGLNNSFTEDNTYILHNKQSRINDIIERGSIKQQGRFVNINYDDLNDNETKRNLDKIKDNSIDLITINMGLHHFDNVNLDRFLVFVKRVLSNNNGLFIIREHDATKNMIPLLDIAHSVFNVVTGVSNKDEMNEIRAFRTISEWKRILGNYGFIDSLQCQMGLNDSTDDYMICVMKPKLIENNNNNALSDSGIDDGGEVSCADTYYRLPEWMIVNVIKDLGNYLDHTPWYRYSYFKFIGLYWKLLYKEMKACYKSEGIKNTMLNGGLAMDTVIGIIFSFMYTQFGILSLPLRMTLGNENPPEFEILKLNAKMKIKNGSNEKIGNKLMINENMFKRIDSRIETQSINKIDDDDFQVMLKVPKHKQFTQIILKLASFSGDNDNNNDDNGAIEFVLENISNKKKEIQIEARIRDADDQNGIDDIDEIVKVLELENQVKVIESFQYPTEYNSGMTRVAMVTDIPNLLNVTKKLNQSPRISDIQIFDFL